MESARQALQTLTSKNAQRALLNVSLLAAFSLPLLCVAAFATGLFFQSYLPDRIVHVPIYLEYGIGLNPYGVSSLEDLNLKTSQAYDITVSLRLPRSPANTDRGNFMVAFHLLGSGTTGSTKATSYTPPDPYDYFRDKNILFTARRPALMPYQDPLVSMASQFVFMLYHLFTPDSRVYVMDIPVAEGVQLASLQSALPSMAFIEIVAGQNLETYNAALVLKAQLSGLRWLMYHYRLLTFVGSTLLFWSAEVLFMMAAWALWIGSTKASFKGSPGKQTRENSEAITTVKREPGSFDDLSDAPHTFPTYGRQPALKYEPVVNAMSSHVGLDEADDEAEEYRRRKWTGDSGIGTSYSEEGGSDIRRRSSNRRPT